MKKAFLGTLIVIISVFAMLFFTADRAEAGINKAFGQCHLVVDFYKNGKFVSKQVYVGYSNDCGAWQSNMIRRINNLVSHNGSIMDSNAVY